MVDGELFGSPITPATAENYRSELGYADGGPDALSFTRIYRSTRANNSSRNANPLGHVWAHHYSASTRDGNC